MPFSSLAKEKFPDSTVASFGKLPYLRLLLQTAITLSHTPEPTSAGDTARRVAIGQVPQAGVTHEPQPPLVDATGSSRRGCGSAAALVWVKFSLSWRDCSGL